MAMKMKLKQLRDADVRYISLVDRAATRMPFRALKRDKESKMGIDLTSVFKSDHPGKPYVSSLVVFSQKDEKVGTQVQEAIKAHGFITDRVQKADDGETVVFAQQDHKGEPHVVRLSDQLLVTVAGLQVPSGWMGEVIEEQGFFPDMKLASSILQEHLTTVSKMDTPQDAAQDVMASYAAYLDQILILPNACYKLDEAITDLIKKCSCEGKDKIEVTKESEEEKEKRIKDHPPAEMAPVDEEDDQKGPPEAYKSEILTALKGIEERTMVQLTGLATKLETVVTEQAAQKKVLDGVVQKADTLSTALKTTVTAVPVQADRPAYSTRMRVEKKDDDPRTGNFDTAFLRRQNR